MLHDTYNVRVVDMGYDTIVFRIEEYLAEPQRVDFASDDQYNYALEVYADQLNRYNMKVARENLDELTVGSLARIKFVNDVPVLLIFKGKQFGVKLEQ